MTTPAEDRLQELLDQSARGDPTATDGLMELLYPELRRLARGRSGSEGATPTLTTTAIVHEAYLRIRGAGPPEGRTPAQFLALASRAMRSVIVDHARHRSARKRGGGRWRVALDEELVAFEAHGLDVLDMDTALTQLEAEHPRAGRIVEMRFFAGLSTSDVASILEISPRTVEREWRVAKAWLRRALAGMDAGT